jgi:ketosteroid isomerase-like protein
MRFYKSVGVILALAFVARSLQAQGLADVATGKKREDPLVAYHAKVRELITTTLQKWTESVQRRDSVATASAYAPNVRSFIGKLPEATTAAAVVQQLFKTSIAGAHLALTVDDFEMSGDLAFVTSILVAQGAPDTAPAYIRTLFVFRFDDSHDRWRVREQFIDWRGELDPSQASQ